MPLESQTEIRFGKSDVAERALNRGLRTEIVRALGERLRLRQVSLRAAEVAESEVSLAEVFQRVTLRRSIVDRRGERIRIAVMVQPLVDVAVRIVCDALVVAKRRETSGGL